MENESFGSGKRRFWKMTRSANRGEKIFEEGVRHKE
jgi:hypothetical protein